METIFDKLHEPWFLSPHGISEDYTKGATKWVLAQQLMEMERMGLVSKTVYAEVPLKTEYRLTALGKSAIPIIRAMDKWGLEHSKQFNELGQLK